MKATLFIKKDHEKLQELFDKYRKAKGAAQNGKRAIFEEIRRELSAHSNIEKELFYPELEYSSSDEAIELMQAALKEHQEIEQLLNETVAAGSNEKQFESRVTQLIETVDEHMLHEEDDVFPQIRQILSEQRLEELGLEMQERKRILIQIAA
jgi:hemerythrin superfamily protein